MVQEKLSWNCLNSLVRGFNPIFQSQSIIWKFNKNFGTHLHVGLRLLYYYCIISGVKWLQCNVRCQIKTKENHTCSSEMTCISCLALSTPSFVPTILMVSDPSLGMVILVAVCSSNCCRVLPPLPRINLWCSRGMLISTLA